MPRVSRVAFSSFLALYPAGTGYAAPMVRPTRPADGISASQRNSAPVAAVSPSAVDRAAPVGGTKTMPDSEPLRRDIELEPDTDRAAVRPVTLATVFLGGLFALAVLAACYAAAAIVLPFVLAFVLSAVLQPVLRFLLRLRLPRVLASLVVVLGLVGVFAMLCLLLSGPIAGRIVELPDIVPRIEQRLHFLSAPIASFQKALQNIASLTPGASPHIVAVESAPLAERILGNVGTVAAGGFTTM